MPSRDDCWAAVQKVAASQNFARAGRLRAFLLYVTECSLENRTDEITEPLIGINVFDRQPGYSPGEDNIVRSAARQLRQRLALYYQEEGSADPVRIQVPRGGYVPLFETMSGSSLNSSVAVSGLDLKDDRESDTATRNDAPKYRLFYGLCLLLGIVLTLLFQQGISAIHLRRSATDPLWRELFSKDRGTLYIPGDAGLNMFNNASNGPQLTLDDYIKRNYLSSLKSLPMTQPGVLSAEQLAQRHYVGIFDLELADRLTRLSRFSRDRYHIKFARDASIEDFRNMNVILAGAPPYNPWVELFDRKLNFHFDYNSADGGNIFVVNRNPLSAELARYIPYIGSHVFGYIALTDNVDGPGKVLLIEGTSNIGVDAAAAFLFDDAKMAPIIAKSKAEGKLLSNFEVLLEATSFTDTSADVKVIATRFYPNLSK